MSDKQDYDVRIEIKNLFIATQKAIEKEKTIAIETVLMIGKLKEWNAACNLGFFEEEYIKNLGLTQDQYYKRLSAYRAIQVEPKLLELLKSKKTHISHLAMIGPKITQANAEMVLDFAPGKSKKEIKYFLSCLSEDGSLTEKEPTIDLHLTIPKTLFEKLERAKEVLAASGKVPSMIDLLNIAFEDLLQKRDPYLKATRAMARAGNKAKKDVEEENDQNQRDEGDKLKKNKVTMNPVSDRSKAGNPPSAPGQKEVKYERHSIPMATQHFVWIRDGGQCTFHLPTGERCPAKGMLEIDHLTPVCRGGDNSPANLRLLCRLHNQHIGSEILGKQVMQNWQREKYDDSSFRQYIETSTKGFDSGQSTSPRVIQGKWSLTS